MDAGSLLSWECCTQADWIGGPDLVWASWRFARGGLGIKMEEGTTSIVLREEEPENPEK